MLLQQAIDDGIVLKKGLWYSLSKDGTKLGNSKIKVQEQLNQLFPDDNPQGSSPQLEPLKKETSSYEQLLGMVKSVKVVSAESNLDVFVNGVNVLNSNHPVVKACPLVFRWRLKENNVDNGGGSTNDGWVVVSKKLTKNPNGTNWLATARDDSPKEDFYSVKEFVLCCANKADYIVRQAQKTAKNIIKPIKESERRQEFMERQAVSSDPKQALKEYAQENQASNEIMRQSMSAKGMTEAEINASLDPEGLIAQAQKLEKQANRSLSDL